MNTCIKLDSWEGENLREFSQTCRDSSNTYVIHTLQFVCYLKMFCTEHTAFCLLLLFCVQEFPGSSPGWRLLIFTGVFMFYLSPSRKCKLLQFFLHFTKYVRYKTNILKKNKNKFMLDQPVSLHFPIFSLSNGPRKRLTDLLLLSEESYLWQIHCPLSTAPGERLKVSGDESGNVWGL